MHILQAGNTCIVLLGINTIVYGLPRWLSGKGSPAKQETQVRKIPCRSEWQLTPVVLPEKFHGQRSLEGYSPWVHKRVGHDSVTKQL